jgi:hypothetical protein
MKKRFFHPSCLLLEGSFFKLFVVPFECLHETNEVREFLVIHSSLETLRHEGKTSTLKGFDFAAEQLPIAAVKEAKLPRKITPKFPTGSVQPQTGIGSPC